MSVENGIVNILSTSVIPNIDGNLPLSQEFITDYETVVARRNENSYENNNEKTLDELIADRFRTFNKKVTLTNKIDAGTYTNLDFASNFIDNTKVDIGNNARAVLIKKNRIPNEISLNKMDFELKPDNKNFMGSMGNFEIPVVNPIRKIYGDGVNKQKVSVEGFKGVEKQEMHTFHVPIIRDVGSIPMNYGKLHSNKKLITIID